MDRTKPRYGQVWEYEGREVFILGNSLDEETGRSIWTADRQSGLRIDAVYENLRPTPATKTPNTFAELCEKCAEWAMAGDSDAAWWLGWRYEGKNIPKSVWYYTAAIRMSPRRHKWAIDRIFSDTKIGALCAGTQAPDISFLKEIPEYRDRRIGRDWAAAVQAAVAAVHIPSTPDQLAHALQLYKAGLHCAEAALQANITQQCLTTTKEFRELDAQLRRERMMRPINFPEPNGDGVWG